MVLAFISFTTSTSDAAKQQAVSNSAAFGPSAPAFLPVKPCKLPFDTEPNDDVEASEDGGESIETSGAGQEANLDGGSLMNEVDPEASAREQSMRARAGAMMSRIIAGGGRSATWVRQVASSWASSASAFAMLPESNTQQQLDDLADLMNGMDEMMRMISAAHPDGDSQTMPSSHRPLAEPDAEPSPTNHKNTAEEEPETLLDVIPSSPAAGTPYPSTSVGSPASEQWTSSAQTSSESNGDDAERLSSIQDSMPEVEPEPDMES
mmetsp:Transcript_28194/g.49215  ORF Transcript_28194/g.49215 Transcript_28194/m.49215 type:complete len:264 (+) Transcript_28194:126-917(+)